MIYYPTWLIDDNDLLFCLAVACLENDMIFKHGSDEYFHSNRVASINYLENFSEVYNGEYWMDDDLKFKTLSEAQYILLKTLFQHQGNVV